MIPLERLNLELPKPPVTLTTPYAGAYNTDVYI